MTTIYKYPLFFNPRQTTALPISARVLHVGLDPNQVPCIWAKVDTDEPKLDRLFFIVGTGNELPVDAKHYIGTYNQAHFVWHLWSADDLS